LPSTLNLDCYLFDTWKPRIRPAPRRRDWMDATPESFAYRCLPLAIANAHGWEIGGGAGFRARWNGGSGVEAIEIELDGACEAIDMPVSLFGQGVVTFHIAGLFRTSPGWNLWVGGPPNHFKDGIAALTGIIETDWSPYSFTMNWRFTRPHHWVRFEPDEPICFFLPIERGVVDGVSPRFRPIADAPELAEQFQAWSASRNAFHAKVAADPPRSPADKWQKLYYRGVDPAGRPGAADHQSKLRTAPFAAPSPRSDATICPVAAPPAPGDPGDDRTLRIQQALRSLSPRLRVIPRVRSIGPERFLDAHYAANWPLLLAYRQARDLAPGVRKAQSRLDAMPARDQALTIEAPADSLTGSDLAAFSGLLATTGTDHPTPLRISRAGAFAPLAEAPANRFHLQLAGRSRILLAPPALAPWLRTVTSRDLLDPSAHERLPSGDGSLFDLTVDAGEAVFVPVGWWSQTRTMEAGASLSRTDFPWRNDWPA
jgi:hypothetical protein